MSKNKKKKKKKYTPHKHKTLFEFSMDYIHKRITDDLPYMYSAVALAMWSLVDGNEEEKYDAIIDLIGKSGAIWNDVVENNRNIIEVCEEVTSIDMREHVG